MGKIREAWVVATRNESAAALTAGAREYAGRLVLFVAEEGPVCAYADEACRLVIPETAPLGCCAAELASRAARDKPELILVESTRDGRMLAAVLAVACGASVFADVSGLAIEDDSVIAERMAYGGSALQVEKPRGCAMVTADPGLFEVEDAPGIAELKELVCAASQGIVLNAREQKAVETVDLSREARVVGVGRGMGSAAGAPAVWEFAAAIGAGIGCSRPVGEEEHWFGDTGYLGISGDTIRPDVYIACGVSGQVQHMVGVNRAGTIFAINKDPKATIFGECDYGIVADMNELIPVLTQKFNQL